MADDIHNEAMDRFAQSQDSTEFNRNAAYKDIKFARLADQWPDKVQKQREEEGRPALTINRMPSFIRQVVNDARQNQPSIVVHPVDNGADEDTAEVISGLVRSIERNSNADIAYDTAIDHAVSGGFGFFRIAIDYAHDDTFNMAAYIERIANPLMVHWDSNSTEFDASDWDYAFVSNFLTQEEFEYQYPEAEPVDFAGQDPRDDVSYWLNDDKIRLAEYWRREPTERKLLLLRGPNGVVTVREDRLPEMAKAALGEMSTADAKDAVQAWMAASGVEVARERMVDVYKVTRHILNANQTLESDDWPGTMIPICPVWGDEVIVDGKRHFRSMIRDARDPQVMLNFWRSATTELVALAPRAPWVGPKGFVPPGEEVKWETANTRSHAYLEYDGPTAPQRQPFAGIPAGAMQEAMAASDDMKAIIGIYDAALGARSNETSGRAILARQREADVSNYHFIDNLSRAIRYAGKVLVEIIPSVYSPQETVRILGEDSTEKVIQLTQGAREGELYNLAVGTYDVDVKTGPSFTTQREETRETIIELMRAVPASAQYLGDALLDHMDFVGADKIARRLRMLLPPEIRQMEDEESDLPPEAQAALAQAQQVIQTLQEQLAQVGGEAQTKQAEMMAEAQAHQQEHAREVAEIQQDTFFKGRELDLKERDIAIKERAAEQSLADAQLAVVERQNELATQERTETAMAQAANALMGLVEVMVNNQETDAVRHGEIMAALTAPKEVTLERDEAGQVSGGVQEIRVN